MKRPPNNAIFCLILAFCLFVLAVFFALTVLGGLRGCSKAASVTINASKTEEPPKAAAISVPIQTACPERYLPTNTKDETEADGAEDCVPEEPKTVLSASPGFTYYETYYDARSQRNERISMPEDLQRLFYDYCQKYGVEYELCLAVTGMETGFNAFIGSLTDENGLTYYGAGMVCVNCTEEHLAKRGITLKTPEGGLEAVALILRDKLNEYGDVHKALIAYNCGSGGADYLISQGIEETAYSKRVMEIYNGIGA